MFILNISNYFFNKMVEKHRMFLLLLITLLLAFASPSAVMGKGKKKPASSSPLDKRIKNRREELKQTKCNFLSEDLMAPCQNYYLSPTCFLRVYGEYGPEFGELPLYSKDTEFIDCVKREMQDKQE